jgi:drug/metabolite transporter (DMT)-like permease
MRLRVVVSYVVLLLCWGATFLWVGIATKETSPLVVGSLRLLVGACTVLSIVSLLGGAVRRAHAPRVLRPWVKRGILTSLPSTAIPFILLALAQRDITSGTASIINAASPLWTSFVFLLGVGAADDRLDRRGYLGLLAGVAGVAVVIGEAPSGSLKGYALVGLMVIAYTSGGVIAGRAFAGAPPYAAAIMVTTLGAVMMLPLGVIGWIANPPDVGAFAALAVLGVTSTGFAYLVYYDLIRTIGVTRTLTVTYLQPLVAIVLGIAFLHEVVHPWHLVGLALILVGVAAVNGQLPLGRRRRAVAVAELPSSG